MTLAVIMGGGILHKNETHPVILMLLSDTSIYDRLPGDEEKKTLFVMILRRIQDEIILKLIRGEA